MGASGASLQWLCTGWKGKDRVLPPCAEVLTEGLQHELRGSSDNADGRVQAHLFVPGFVNTNLAVNYFRELKGDAFDAEADVPWSEEKPAKGGWMPMETIDYLFDAIAARRFYIICPDNDVRHTIDSPTPASMDQQPLSHRATRCRVHVHVRACACGR